MRTLVVLMLLLAPVSAYAHGGLKGGQDSTKSGSTFWQRTWDATKRQATKSCVRVGYNLGATAPLGIPAGSTIKAFSPGLTPAISLETDIHLWRWLTLAVGLRGEYKGMRTVVGVKNFQTEVTMEGMQRAFAGSFTGINTTQVSIGYVGIPIRFAFTITPRYRLLFGGYVAWAAFRSFRGSVSDGYIWSTPTEAEPNSTRSEIEEQGYDFSSELRQWDYGVELFGRHLFTEHLFLDAGLSFGIPGVFKSTFTGVPFTMRNIYAQLAMGYDF